MNLSHGGREPTAGRALVLGSVNMDMILLVTALPASGETVLGEDAVFRPGGKGANLAVAAALAGARVIMAGHVGNDPHAAAVRDALVRVGVDISLLHAATGRSTGLAVVLVAPDGENAIAVASGANHAIVPDDVERLRPQIQRADLLLLQMELPIDVVVHAVKIGADMGTAVVLNLAPAVAVPHAVLERLDVLVVNRAEAEDLLGEEVPDLPALTRAVNALRPLGPGAVVVTAGAEGAAFGSPEGSGHVRSRPVEVVDTSGAGDAFVGVLASELSRGRPLRDSVVAATDAGAIAVQSRGAQLTSFSSAASQTSAWNRRCA